MNAIDQLNEYLAAHPAASAWVDEVLIRGGPADGPGWGVVRGAHFTIGLRETGPLGEPVTRLVGPLPAAVVPDDPGTPIAALIGQVVVQQQRTIDQQAADLAAAKTAGDAKDQQIAGLTAQLAATAKGENV